MNKINLILPGNGATDWGNNINKNFIQLLQEQKNLRDSITRVQSLISQRDGLVLDAEKFVYLEGVEQGESLTVNAYLVSFNDWDDPSSSTEKSSFDPSTEDDMQAYVVQISFSNSSDSNSFTSLPYQGEQWLTNDILYIYKDINNLNTVLRWPSSIGGYYEPTKVRFDQSNGSVIIDYIRKPACITDPELTPSIETTIGFRPNTKIINGVKDGGGPWPDDEYVWRTYSDEQFIQLFNVATTGYLCDIQFFTSDNNRFYIGYSISVVGDNIQIDIPLTATIPDGTKFTASVIQSSEPASQSNS